MNGVYVVSSPLLQSSCSLVSIVYMREVHVKRPSPSREVCPIPSLFARLSPYWATQIRFPSRLSHTIVHLFLRLHFCSLSNQIICDQTSLPISSPHRLPFMCYSVSPSLLSEIEDSPFILPIHFP